MAGVYSKFSNDLSSWCILSSSPFICHLLSSLTSTNCPSFLVALLYAPSLSSSISTGQFSARSSRNDLKLWRSGESMKVGIEIDNLTYSGLNEAAD
ncbi:hypothetical protein SAY87_015945 [Trapa incisa]|uniref:Uncharacterized protein n=1 Tax=Trapa incisa TaxID=236973 RepID=A0AAN7QU15_9MYRT|nr:hypothetical protein SAY87_015945 [Trapa incisa]